MIGYEKLYDLSTEGKVKGNSVGEGSHETTTRNITYMDIDKTKNYEV